MMRRPLYIILGALVSVLCLTSCKENYYIENDLHGVWQITSVERLSTGDINPTKGELFFMFQRTMAALCENYINTPEGISRVIAQFDPIEPDSIRMGNFRVYSTGEGNNINLETKVSISSLNKFGIYQDNTTFHLQQSKQKMTLTSDSARIELRKY